jgi:hypothetical protein
MVAAAFFAGPVHAQQEHERVAQGVQEMFPATPRPPPEMKCPPDRWFNVNRMFLQQQDLCARAGRPFNLNVKWDTLRICERPETDCGTSVLIPVKALKKGEWVVFLKRAQGGLVLVQYLTSRGYTVEGYVQAAGLESPQPRY